MSNSKPCLSCLELAACLLTGIHNSWLGRLGGYIRYAIEPRQKGCTRYAVVTSHRVSVGVHCGPEFRDGKAMRPHPSGLFTAS